MNNTWKSFEYTNKASDALWRARRDGPFSIIHLGESPGALQESSLVGEK